MTLYYGERTMGLYKELMKLEELKGVLRTEFIIMHKDCVLADEMDLWSEEKWLEHNRDSLVLNLDQLARACTQLSACSKHLDDKREIGILYTASMTVQELINSMIVHCHEEVVPKCVAKGDLT